MAFWGTSTLPLNTVVTARTYPQNYTKCYPQCSSLLPGEMLRDHSCWGLEDCKWCWGMEPLSGTCKASLFYRRPATLQDTFSLCCNNSAALELRKQSQTIYEVEHGGAMIKAGARTWAELC